MTYRIMQYNILHQKKGWGADRYLDLGLAVRSENVKRAINEANPHILVLAERHDEWAGIEVPYSDVSVDLTHDLEKDFAFVENMIEGGKTVNRTPIAYKKNTFRCIDAGSYELGEEHSFERSQNKRVVSFAILEALETSNRISVFSTHWSSGQPQELINMQSKNMQSVIKNVSNKYSDIPVVVAADFNTLYNNEAYQSLLSGCSLSDVDRAVNGSDMDCSIVDHIAIKGCSALTFIKPTDAYTDRASDHKPIICDICV